MVTELLKTHSWVLGPLFIVVLILVVWVRKRFTGGADIKPTDAAIALIPFILWMATAGIFKKVEVPGVVAFETADAIVKAAGTPIENQVSPLPVTRVSADPKSGVGEIQKLMTKGTEALSFELGRRGYFGPAIWMYMVNLSRLTSFRYIVVIKQNGSLFGIFDPSKLVSALNPPNNDELIKKYPLKPFKGLPQESDVAKWSQFADDLIGGHTRSIQKHPGFLPSKQAVTPGSDKQQVLNLMETLRRDWLPVVNEAKREFTGIVDRSRLTASLILDIASQVQAGRKEIKKDQ